MPQKSLTKPPHAPHCPQVGLAAADELVVVPRSVPQLAVAHRVASKEAVSPAQDGWAVSEVPNGNGKSSDGLLALFKKIVARPSRQRAIYRPFSCIASLSWRSTIVY